MNSGIGLAVALDVAANGFRSVGSVRSEEKAEIVTKAAADAGVTVETVLLDINDAAGCEQVIDTVRPDAIVNNAGYLVYAPVELIGDDEVHDLFETLVFAPMRLARLALPHMRERRWGRIVNVSSLVGRVSMPMLGWYSAAKHALEAASDAMRVEVASSGVAVILIEPGTVGTNIFGEFDAHEDRFRGQGYDTPYGRFRLQLNLSKLMAISPDKAARSIRKTLQVRVPRARYLLGADANLVVRTTPFVPTRLRDPRIPHRLRPVSSLIYRLHVVRRSGPPIAHGWRRGRRGRRGRDVAGRCCHDDRLHDRSDLERNVLLQVLAAFQRDTSLNRRKPGSLDADDVLTRQEVAELESPGVVARRVTGGLVASARQDQP